MVTSYCRGRPGNIFLHLAALACGRRMDNDHIRFLPLPAAMKRRLVLSLLFLSLLGSAGGVWAQAQWRDLPPDERRQMRQQMRDHWQQQREIRREEGAPRWRDV